jgi:hypothetical protein
MTIEELIEHLKQYPSHWEVEVGVYAGEAALFTRGETFLQEQFIWSEWDTELRNIPIL